MANRLLVDRHANGDVILKRFDRPGQEIPAPVAPVLEAFRGAHRSFVVADKAVTRAQIKEQEGLKAVSRADSILDKAIDDMADELVGAKVTPRQSAFKGLSPHSPSEMKDLAFAKEAAAVGALLDQIELSNPPEAVQAKAQLLKEMSAAVQEAIANHDVLAMAWAHALQKRDALFPAWDEALDALKRKATGDFDKLTFNALFAPPDLIHRPRKPRKKSA